MMNLWQKARIQIKRLTQVDYSSLYKPVLSQQALKDLCDWAIENNEKVKQSHARVRQSYGELESQKFGHGLDFEHSRVYHPSDERKHINWRLSARMQELHVKQFNEFQQSKVFLFIDGFSSMRFGTRRRTKIAQAIRAALYIAHSAKCRHCQVYARVVTAQTTAQLAPSDYSGIENYLNRAYPPSDEISADEIANHWQNHLASVDATQHLLVVISDFQFLSTLNSSKWRQFSQSIDAGAAIAVQIKDPIEIRLPNSGIFTLSSANNTEVKEYDMSSLELHDKYQQSLSQYYKEIEDRLRLAFIQTISLQSADERIDNLLQNTLINFI